MLSSFNACKFGCFLSQLTSPFPRALCAAPRPPDWHKEDKVRYFRARVRDSHREVQLIGTKGRSVRVRESHRELVQKDSPCCRSSSTAWSAGRRPRWWSAACWGGSWPSSPPWWKKTFESWPPWWKKKHLKRQNKDKHLIWPINEEKKQYLSWPSNTCFTTASAWPKRSGEPGFISL